MKILRFIYLSYFSLLILSANFAIGAEQAATVQSSEEINAEYNEMLSEYKQNLRQFHNKEDQKDPGTYPLQMPKQDALLIILNADGTPNKGLEPYLSYEVNNVWDSQGRIKVVSWMSKWAYDNFWAPDKTKNRGIIGTSSTFKFPNDSRSWVTISGDIRDYFMEAPKRYDISKFKSRDEANIAAALKVAQLLGAPPPISAGKIDTNKVFVEFWVSPDDLYRPTRTASIKKGYEHNLAWQVKNNPDASQYDDAIYEYKPVINEEGKTVYKWVKLQELQTNDIVLFEPKYSVIFYQIQPGIKYRNNYKNDILYHLIGKENDKLRGEEYKFPFTALGYSYNWDKFIPHDPKNMKAYEHIGASEFVVKGGSKYELDGVYQTLDYVTNEHPNNLLKKDSGDAK